MNQEASSRLVAFGSLVVLTLLTGCGISGRWETARVEPERSPFQHGIVTFGADGRYTASVRIDGDVRTSTGTYRLAGGSLVLTPTTGPERTYRCRTSASGTTLFVEHSDGETLHVATLNKID